MTRRYMWVLNPIMMILLLLLQYHHVAAAASTIGNTTTTTTQYLSGDMQKLALFQFKLSFSINTFSHECNGYYYDNPSWHMMNWSMNSDYCKQWEGVTCNQTTRDVIGLDLSCRHLDGSIHPNSTLFQLSHLQFLNLDNNDFRGVIPEEIFHLPNLKRLSLRAGVFENHNLSVSLPKLEWGSNTTLESLDLSDINIIGGVVTEQIFHLPNLKELYLYPISNLSVSLPRVKWGCNNTLQTLALHSLAIIGGVIPEEIFHLPNLEELDIGSNHNDHNVSLPKLKWGSSTTLQSLSLFFLTIIGGVPRSVGYLNSLKYLSLWVNNLTGPLPESISNLTQLTVLELIHNNMSGRLPDSLANLHRLKSVILPGNSFNGEFPSWVANLTQLQTLDLSGNSLTGTIPSSFSSSSLRKFDCSYNLLNGTIPTSFSGLVNLSFIEYLDLSENQIDGDIPDWIGSVGTYSLFYLDISHNNLTGGLEHLTWNNIQYIDLQSNKLNGFLPAFVCNMTSLDVLNLSHNNLSGVLPVCPSSLNYTLSVFDLGMNTMGGSLPSELSNFHKLRTLKLHGNKLEGMIPHSFSKFQNLELLDLGNNHINDVFPHCLEALPSLQVLVLKSNKFHGIINDISKVEHSFPSLRIIDLSDNEFTGPLPAKYIKNFKGMMNGEVNKMGLKYMEILYYSDSVSLVIKGIEIELVKILTVLTTIDLSGNKFEGEIPECIGNLKSLIYLNLSHNQLTGNIPSTIAKLSMLESLDLALNRFEGEIPPQLKGLCFLSHLNLSQNALSGHIPKGNQFNTFGNDSYAGNSMLCGYPLSKKCRRDNNEPQEEDGDDDYFFNGFTWEAVVMGYACGMVMGFIGGYIMFMAGKPKWYVGIIARG